VSGESLLTAYRVGGTWRSEDGEGSGKRGRLNLLENVGGRRNGGRALTRDREIHKRRDFEDRESDSRISVIG
jgi:hypothetical protein